MGLSLVICGHTGKTGQEPNNALSPRVAPRPAREVAWLPAIYFQSTDLSRMFSLSPRIQTVDRPMPALPHPQPYSRKISFRGLNLMSQGV